jgi:hypothetical protein
MKLVMCTVLLILAGCGGNAEDADTARERPVREDRETVFDPMVSNIDKAKQVEQQVLDQKRKMDEAIEAAESDQD